MKYSTVQNIGLFLYSIYVYVYNIKFEGRGGGNNVAWRPYFSFMEKIKEMSRLAMFVVSSKAPR